MHQTCQRFEKEMASVAQAQRTRRRGPREGQTTQGLIGKEGSVIFILGAWATWDPK